MLRYFASFCGCNPLACVFFEFVCVDCEDSHNVKLEDEGKESLKFLEKIFLFNKHFKNNNPDEVIMYSVGNKFEETFNYNQNINLEFKNKALYKHFDDLDIHNYKIANDAENKSKKVLIVKNTNLFEFERLINYSKLAISCHSGFMVQVCGANRSEVLDILNEEDSKWIDRWIPLNTNYKRIFKRINNKSLNFDEIIRQIN